MAKFISRRDGYPADADDIILTNGGSIGIQVRQTIYSTQFCSEHVYGYFLILKPKVSFDGTDGARVGVRGL